MRTRVRVCEQGGGGGGSSLTCSSLSRQFIDFSRSMALEIASGCGGSMAFIRKAVTESGEVPLPGATPRFFAYSESHIEFILVRREGGGGGGGFEMGKDNKPCTTYVYAR